MFYEAQVNRQFSVLSSLHIMGLSLDHVFEIITNFSKFSPMRASILTKNIIG